MSARDPTLLSGTISLLLCNFHLFNTFQKPGFQESKFVFRNSCECVLFPEKDPFNFLGICCNNNGDDCLVGTGAGIHAAKILGHLQALDAVLRDQRGILNPNQSSSLPVPRPFLDASSAPCPHQKTCVTKPES